MLKNTFIHDALLKILPPSFFKIDWLRIDLWQWIALFLLCFTTYLLSWYMTKISLKITYRLILRQVPSFDKIILRAAFAPLRLGFLVLFFAFGIEFLTLDPKVYKTLFNFEKLLIIFVFTWLVFRVVDVFRDWLTEQLQEQQRFSTITMLPLAGRTLKIAVSLLASITLIQNLGVNVTALLAGLGVGGIAIALAAQKTLENLLGGVLLILDHPIRVGDDCQFGTQRGVVEDIGLRTTKIRTADRSLLSVPNSDFAQMQLENFSSRDRIRFFITLSLRYETTADQVRCIIIELRKILYAHPKVDKDPARVRLAGFGTYALNIDVVAYILTTEHAEFTGIREDLLLRFMDVIEKSGTRLAIPSQTTYFLPDAKPDPQKIQIAEMQVEKWRRANEMPIPEFSESQIEEIDDTLDYPPKGSVKGSGGPSP